MISKEAIAAETGLDPEAQVIVGVLGSQKPLFESTPSEARFQRESKKNPFALDPRELAKTEDLEIQTCNGQIPGRLYVPKSNSTTSLPCLVYFHGGGFVLGSIETHDTIAQNLAAEVECCVISVGYRLAPENPFPCAVDDAFDAFHWVLKQSELLGIDPEKVAIGGDSAGGNLAAVTCLRNQDEKVPTARFQVLIYPATDNTYQKGSRETFKDGPFLDRPTIEWFNRLYLKDATEYHHPYSSPLLSNDLAGLPPALVITAGYDPLRDEGKAYADKLESAGVSVSHTCYADMFHGFLSFGNSLPQAKEAIREIASLLKCNFNI